MLEIGSLVWSKDGKRPYWPGIISKKIEKPTGVSYNVLYFGTFNYGTKMNRKWFEPYDGLVEFKKRILELKASQIAIKNIPSRYDLNITPATFSTLKVAIKQASEFSKCTNPIDRLKLAENMCKRRKYDFCTLKLDDEEIIEDNDETTSNISEMTTLTDQQFNQTMITHGRKKLKLEDDENQSDIKIRRITIKNEPEQVL